MAKSVSQECPGFHPTLTITLPGAMKQATILLPSPFYLHYKGNNSDLPYRLVVRITEILCTEHCEHLNALNEYFIK